MAGAGCHYNAEHPSSARLNREILLQRWPYRLKGVARATLEDRQILNFFEARESGELTPNKGFRGSDALL
jgi:hypothetical protein